MATTTDGGFHEIQLNGKQLVFLFMAVTVVSVVIFLCGVLVGRGVRTEAAAPDPLIAQEAPAPASEAPPAPSSSSSGASPTANETLSYPDRLANANPAREQLRNPSSTTPRPDAPAASAAVSPPPPSPPSPAPREAVPATAGRPEPAGPGFAIQLTALRQREEADGIARRLNAKGYPAYVLTPEAGAPVVFRVRVGKFKDRSEAESVKARLEKEEQFKPWIVR